jgi:hypothetical protein
MGNRKGVLNMNNERFKNVEIGLNYGTTDTDATDVIYLLEGEKDNTNAIFSITLDEAEWLSKKLIDFVNKFGQENTSQQEKQDVPADEKLTIKSKLVVGKEFPFAPID